MSKPTTELIEEMLRGMDEQEQQDQTPTSAINSSPGCATTPLADPRITTETPVVKTQHLAARERRTMPLTEGDQ